MNPGAARRRHRSAAGLAAFIGGSGILHFAVPGPYRGIVPRPLRDHSAEVVALSGVCELACAGLLLLPRTRSLGAWATVALLVAVFPANVQMALDSGGHGTPYIAGSWLRLPLQLPLIAWALSLRSR